jgi:Fe2+ or Zn2+ uptake regulation protein
MVLEALYKVGIGGVIHAENLFREADDSLSRDQFYRVLKDFAEAELITRTGQRGEIVFVSNLALAHIFGVSVVKRVEYNLNPKLFGVAGQLSLPWG